MKEELRKLRTSVQLVKAETAYLKEGFNRLDERVGDMASDVDAFIDVYVKDYTKLEQRVSALEKDK